MYSSLIRSSLPLAITNVAIADSSPIRSLLASLARTTLTRPWRLRAKAAGRAARPTWSSLTRIQSSVMSEPSLMQSSLIQSSPMKWSTLRRKPLRMQSWEPGRAEGPKQSSLRWSSVISEPSLMQCHHLRSDGRAARPMPSLTWSSVMPEPSLTWSSTNLADRIFPAPPPSR